MLGDDAEKHFFVAFEFRKYRGLVPSLVVFVPPSHIGEDIAGTTDQQRFAIGDNSIATLRLFVFYAAREGEDFAMVAIGDIGGDECSTFFLMLRRQRWRRRALR